MDATDGHTAMPDLPDGDVHVDRAMLASGVSGRPAQLDLAATSACGARTDRTGMHSHLLAVVVVLDLTGS